jgi:G3E family GTPase
MALPATVIGGYLGAGKTTLVNHLLRHANGRRLGVLVNEFGALPIDADLIQGQHGRLMTVIGGCMCCSYGDELLSALQVFAAQPETLDHLLIECSGVAMPGAIAHILASLPGIVLDAVVVVVDSETIRAHAADRWISDTVTRQLADADMVIANKTDLATEGLLPWLADTAPRAKIVPALQGKVAPELVLGLAAPSAYSNAEHTTNGYDDASFRLRRPVDARALADALVLLPLVRAKGFVQDRDLAWKTIQIVGRRAEVTAAPAGEQGPARLVCIAHGPELDRAGIARTLAQHAVDAA